MLPCIRLRVNPDKCLRVLPTNTRRPNLIVESQKWRRKYEKYSENIILYDDPGVDGRQPQRANRGLDLFSLMKTRTSSALPRTKKVNRAI
jgi:hypothetical protein